MDLVAPLSSGIADAPNGSATFTLRGTATPTTVYSDFEGTVASATGIVALSSIGVAEVYVAQIVDCVVKNAAGTTVREFTCGHKSTNVEYIGPSFTGTGYTGSPTAVNQPTTVKAVLDSWITSAGKPDFNVAFGLTSISIQSALGSIGSVYVNVQSPEFGAVGDGVTDDTASIQAAVATAVSGRVGLYFPAGTYLVTDTLVDTVSMIGDNAILTKNTTGDLCEVGATSTFYSGMTFRLTAGTTDALFVGSGPTLQFYFQDCTLTATGGATCRCFTGAHDITMNRVSIGSLLDGTVLLANKLSMTRCVVDSSLTSGYWGDVDGELFAAFNTINPNGTGSTDQAVWNADAASSVIALFNHVSDSSGTGGRLVNAGNTGSSRVIMDVGNTGRLTSSSYAGFSYGTSSASGATSTSRDTKSATLNGSTSTSLTPTELANAARLTILTSAVTSLAIDLTPANVHTFDGNRSTIVLSNQTGAGISVTLTADGEAAHLSFTLGASSKRTIDVVNHVGTAVVMRVGGDY